MWAKDEFAFNTIQISLSAINDWHRSRKVARDPQDLALISSTLKSVQLLLGPLGHADKKLGMSVDLLRRVSKTIGDAYTAADSWLLKLLHLRDFAWLLISFFGFLRRSEAAALLLSDIRFDTIHNPPAVVVHIRKSKTDALSRGVDICLAWSTASGFMIGLYVQLYVTLLVNFGYPKDFPLFMALGSPSVLNLDCTVPRPLRADTMSGRLQLYLKTLAQTHPELRIDVKRFSAHSLRRGGATAAWLSGVPREVLAVHGRWKSDAVDLYLVADTLHKLRVTQQI